VAKVFMKTTLKAPADAVWKTVRDFGAPTKYVAAISKSTLEGAGVGARRILDFQGSRIVERLESLDDAKRTLTYTIVEGELPFADYLSTMQVRDLGKGRCELAWSCTFEPIGAPEADCKGIIEGVYSAGFAGLKKLHGG